MKSPGTLAYLFGNALVFVATGLWSLYVLYAVFTGQWSFWWILWMAIILGYVDKSRRAVKAYMQWQQEWNGMDGTLFRQSRRSGGKWLRYTVSLGLWAGMAFMFMSDTARYEYEIAAILFWCGTVVMVGYLAYRVAMQTIRSTMSDNAVTICVPVPLNSPSIVTASQQLPVYCSNIPRPST